LFLRASDYSMTPSVNSRHWQERIPILKLLENYWLA